MSVFGKASREPADETRVEPITGASASSEASRLRQSISQAAEQIDKIIGAAEEAASEIQAAAAREAERYLAERRREAESLRARQQFEVARAFADLRARLAEIEASALAGEAPQPAGSPPSAPTELRTAAAPDPNPAASAAGQNHTLAVIRAAQLAIVGTPREDIERMLRDELGVERAGEIVDQVLPPG
jgi:cell division septum initiation protein DivIVA